MPAAPEVEVATDISAAAVAETERLDRVEGPAGPAHKVSLASRGKYSPWVTISSCWARPRSTSRRLRAAPSKAVQAGQASRSPGLRTTHIDFAGDEIGELFALHVNGGIATVVASGIGA